MIRGLVSTLGAGIAAVSTAARVRVTGSTTGSGAGCPSGTHSHILLVNTRSLTRARPSSVDVSQCIRYHRPLSAA